MQSVWAKVELWKNTQALEEDDEESAETPTRLYCIYVNCTFTIESLFLKQPTRASQITQQNHMVDGENRLIQVPHTLPLVAAHVQANTHTKKLLTTPHSNILCLKYFAFLNKDIFHKLHWKRFSVKVSLELKYFGDKVHFPCCRNKSEWH